MNYKHRPLKHLILMIGLLFTAALACGKQPAATPPQATETPAAIPQEYQALYNELDGNLTEFLHLLTFQQGIGFKPLTLAAELLPANANRGETLLDKKTLEGARVYLDALQALGAGGVKVTINYPLFSPDYPRNSEYVEFYRQVASMVRQRNMKLLVGAGVIFTDPTFSSTDVDYSTLTLETYIQGLRLHIETILREIQPDYLTILNEPDTLSSIIGLEITLDNYELILNRAITDLDRGSTALGAGAGNWNDLAYIEYVAKNKAIDYIDIHFYPLSRDQQVRLFEFGEIARQNSKRLVIGEAWLYKASSSELSGASAAEIISRDVYSFWQPLDQRFLTLLVRFAKQNRVEFASAFWSKYFFAYLDYQNTPKALSPGQLLERANQSAVVNILAGSHTMTGETYKGLTRK
jgi:hypothetical protein